MAPLTERPSESGSWNDFSLCQGGPLQRIGGTLGLPGGARGLVSFGPALAVLTWVPLAALSALGNTETVGPTVPFLQSLGTHVRLLVAIPLFFVAEAAFDLRVRQAMREMVASHLVPERQLPLLDTALRQARHWAHSWMLEALIVGLTIVLIWSGIRRDLPGELSTWRHTSGGRLSLAGGWYMAVSLPVYQFLVWRWCARLLIWGRLLWRIRQLDLQLLPTHPDLAGGLGPLGVTHLSLAPLSFAVSGMIAATLAEQLMHGGTDIRRVVPPLVVTLVGTTLALMGPLLLFTPRLVQSKQRGLLEYGGLAATYTRAFDQKWLRSGAPPTESLLGSADLQSLADLANAFNVIDHMRIIPMARSQIVVLFAAAALPALPLVLFVIPVDQLIIRAVRTVLHL